GRPPHFSVRPGSHSLQKLEPPQSSGRWQRRRFPGIATPERAATSRAADLFATVVEQFERMVAMKAADLLARSVRLAVVLLLESGSISQGFVGDFECGGRIGWIAGGLSRHGTHGSGWSAGGVRAVRLGLAGPIGSRRSAPRAAESLPISRGQLLQLVTQR